MSLKSQLSPFGCAPGVRRLRAGYTRAKYIEGTGTQYIDPGIKANSSISVRMMLERTRMQYGDTNQRNGTGADSFFYTIVVDWNFSSEYAGVIYANSYSEVKMTTFKQALGHHRVCLSPYNGVCWIDGVGFDADARHYAGTRNFMLFARSVANSVGLFCFQRLYEVQIDVDGETKRDMVPALDDNGSPCLYDLVSHDTFYNQGSGNFLYEI